MKRAEKNRANYAASALQRFIVMTLQLARWAGKIGYLARAPGGSSGTHTPTTARPTSREYFTQLGKLPESTFRAPSRGRSFTTYRL
jgi:hypothetical protein